MDRKSESEVNCERIFIRDRSCESSSEETLSRQKDENGLSDRRDVMSMTVKSYRYRSVDMRMGM